jgi:hypothetical protein
LYATFVDPVTHALYVCTALVACRTWLGTWFDTSLKEQARLQRCRKLDPIWNQTAMDRSLMCAIPPLYVERTTGAWYIVCVFCRSVGTYGIPCIVLGAKQFVVRCVQTRMQLVDIPVMDIGCRRSYKESTQNFLPPPRTPSQSANVCWSNWKLEDVLQRRPCNA